MQKQLKKLLNEYYIEHIVNTKNLKIEQATYAFNKDKNKLAIETWDISENLINSTNPGLIDNKSGLTQSDILTTYGLIQNIHEYSFAKSKL